MGRIDYFYLVGLLAWFSVVSERLNFPHLSALFAYLEIVPTMAHGTFKVVAVLYRAVYCAVMARGRPYGVPT